MMYILNATPHAGFHIFNHTGEEITEDWFIGDSYLGHSANGFYFEDFNNDGNTDILMVDVYTENYSETVFYLNNGEKFVMKTIELDPNGGWVFPIDINQDGMFEVLKFDAQYSEEVELTYSAYLNNLDYSDALNTENFSNELNIYPTVTNNYIFFESNEPLEVIIFDITGKEILRKTIHYNLNLKNFENGVYLMKVMHKSNSLTKKIDNKIINEMFY